MTESESNQSMISAEEMSDKVGDIMDQFLATGHVQTVYGKPVQTGQYTTIPAAEVMSVAGFGMGSGYGSAPNEDLEKTSEGGGGGGGGGGRVMARPVAVIVCGPDGVEVKPVVDVTKIGIAVLTTLGFMATMANRMQRHKLKLD